MLTSFHTSKKNLLRRYDAAGRNARKKAKLFLRMTIPQKRKDNENWSLPLRGIYLLVLVDTDKLTYNDKDRIIAPFYDIELETGIVISTLIMPRKEWENRPFLTPFQYNVKKEGIVL